MNTVNLYNIFFKILMSTTNRDIIKEYKKFEILKNLKKNKIIDNDEDINVIKEDDMLGKLVKENTELVNMDLSDVIKKHTTIEKNVPVNKGHFDLDAKERKDEFKAAKQNLDAGKKIIKNIGPFGMS